MDPRTVALNQDITDIQDFTQCVFAFQNHLRLLHQQQIPITELEEDASSLAYRAIYIHDLIFVQRGAQLRRLARVNRAVAACLRLAMLAQEDFRAIMLEHFIPRA